MASEQRTSTSVLNQVKTSAADLHKVLVAHPEDELTESYFSRVARLYTELDLNIKQNQNNPTYIVSEKDMPSTSRKKPIVDDEFIIAKKDGKIQYIAIHPECFVYNQDVDGVMIPELTAWYSSFMTIISF